MQISIKIRDGTLQIASDVLTLNSSKFAELINDLGFHEIEIDDFDPDTVRIFLTLIEETEVNEFEKGRFRELHKLAVVFAVTWLESRCREWLGDQIESISADSSHELLDFLLDEAVYIHDKWKIETLTDLFIRSAGKWFCFSNIQYIISSYLKQDGDLNHTKLYVLLKMCGGNTKIVLKALFCRVIRQNSLDAATKHILGIINLPLCFEHSPNLYFRLLDVLRYLEDLSSQDLRFILDLEIDTQKKVLMRKNFIVDPILLDRFAQEEIDDQCETLDDVINAATNGSVKNMFGVLDLLVKVVALNPPEVEAADHFVSSLEDLYKDKPSRRASSRYVDMLMTAMIKANQPQTKSGVMLLEKLQKSKLLVSKHDHIVLKLFGDESLEEFGSYTAVRIVQFTLGPVIRMFSPRSQSRELSTPRSLEHPYSEPHPFRLKIEIVNSKDGNQTVRACTEQLELENNYNVNRLFSSARARFYFTVRGPCDDGTEFTVPNQLMGRWSKWWFHTSSFTSRFNTYTVTLVVEYYASDYTVI